MPKHRSIKPRDRLAGRAVDDEDPNHSPMDDTPPQVGPAQPLDVDRVEQDRAKSMGGAKGSAFGTRKPRRGEQGV